MKIAGTSSSFESRVIPLILGLEEAAPDEAILDFDPVNNEIDEKLFDNIVDYSQLFEDGGPLYQSSSNMSSLNDSYRQQTDGEGGGGGEFTVDGQSSGTNSDDELAFRKDAAKGFNTNMDDFLKRFESVVAEEGELMSQSDLNSPKRRRASQVANSILSGDKKSTSS